MEGTKMSALFEIVNYVNANNIAKCTCYEDRLVLETIHLGGFHLFEYYTYQNKKKTIMLDDIKEIVISGSPASPSTSGNSDRRYIQILTVHDDYKPFRDVSAVYTMMAIHLSLIHNAIYLSDFKKNDLEATYKTARAMKAFFDKKLKQL